MRWGASSAWCPLAPACWWRACWRRRQRAPSRCVRGEEERGGGSIGCRRPAHMPHGKQALGLPSLHLWRSSAAAWHRLGRLPSCLNPAPSAPLRAWSPAAALPTHGPAHSLLTHCYTRPATHPLRPGSRTALPTHCYARPATRPLRPCSPLLHTPLHTPRHSSWAAGCGAQGHQDPPCGRL